MALVVSHLDGVPEKQPGETTCVLKLDRTEQTGFRVRATVAETGRELARFMSDCAFSVCQTALLWASRYEWEQTQDPQSMDITAALNQMQRPTPMVPAGGVHIRDVLDALAENLPPRPAGAPQLGIAGGGTTLALPGPVVGQVDDDEPLRQGRRRRPRARLSREARELGQFLVEATQQLREGVPYEDVLDQLADMVDEGEEEDDLDELPPEPPPQPRRRPRQPAPHPQITTAQPQPQLPMAAQPASPMQPTAHPGFAPGHQPLVMGPAGPRALQPGEVPPGLSAEQQQEFQGMASAGEAAAARREQKQANDYQKYQAHLPPLTPEQQAEVEAAKAEFVARRAGTAPPPEPQPYQLPPLAPGAILQTPDRKIWMGVEDGPPVEVVMGPDGNFYYANEEDQPDDDDDELIDYDDDLDDDDDDLDDDDYDDDDDDDDDYDEDDDDYDDDLDDDAYPGNGRGAFPVTGNGHGHVAVPPTAAVPPVAPPLVQAVPPTAPLGASPGRPRGGGKRGGGKRGGGKRRPKPAQ